jgi:hypothetical protein
MAVSEKSWYNPELEFGVIKDLKLQSRFDIVSPKRLSHEIFG